MADSNPEAQSGPPMPRIMYQIANPIVGAVLHSPLHGMMSGRLILLSFTGRKSGTQYTIPVGYLQEANRLYVFTHSSWWKNLRGGAPVTVQLRGTEVQGAANVVEDEAAIMQIIHKLVARDGDKMAPVSYTHLDVYKRQEEESKGRQAQGGTSQRQQE